MNHESDLDDGINFDVFDDYGSKSPLRIKSDVIEDCWRKRCSPSNFGVLLTKKCFSEKERATYIQLYWRPSLGQKGFFTQLYQSCA